MAGSPFHAAAHAASLRLALVALALGAASAQAQAPSTANASPSLDQVRTALDKYQDPLAAVREGYLSTLGCIDFPSGLHEGMDHGPTMAYKPGGMGVHFVNMGLIGPTLDPMKPQVLIYEPVGDKLRLAAAEWFEPMPLAANGPPSVLGKSLEGPMEGHPPILPAELHHYDLHVWLWKNNPSGVFHPTNPDVTCQPGPYTHHDGPPRMVKTGASK